MRKLTEEQKQDLLTYAFSVVAFPLCVAAGIILPKINSGDWTASLFICFPMAAFFAYSVYFYHEIKRRKKDAHRKATKKVA